MSSYDPYQVARDFAEYTHHSFFLTGKAGSGKTTLLKEIIAATQKNYVILAPTGIAAINAGGVTIHSFFTIPTRTFLPTHAQVDNNIAYNIRDLFHHAHYRKEKIELIRSLDTIVIDEISMCRADIMDAMNHILKNVRRNQRPFGGVQLLMIGDLYQLPPVAKDAEWAVMREYYNSPFFFDAKVFEDNLPLQIELDKIYRQTDEKYIHVLNNIRNNIAGEEDYRILNERCQPMDTIPEDYIVLTTHNRKADEINRRKLAELPGEPQTYTAKVSGDFHEWNYPCEETLKLKTGTRVMFIKNDTRPEKKYFNGKLGTVKRMLTDSIVIESGDEEIELERETWRNIRYTFNAEKESVDEDELGAYRQFPLRLAWAITVHKSQGLTFEKAVLDIGASFAAGQVYVALSRCTSLEGMILSSPIRGNQVMIDPGVLRFLEKSVRNDVPQLLEDEKIAYTQTYLKKIFEFQGIHNLMESVIERLEKKPSEKKIEAIQQIMAWQNQNNAFIDTATRFHNQIDTIFRTQSGEELIATLKERTRKGAHYFITECYQPFAEKIEAYYRELYRQKQTKKLSKEILSISHLVDHKIGQMYDVKITDEKVYNEPRKQKEQSAEKEISKLAKKNTRDITLEIFLECKDMLETAKIREMALTTIEGHLADAVEQNKLDVLELISRERLDAVVKAIGMDNKETRLGELMSKTKGEFTYGELRFAVSYIRSKQ